MKTFSTVIVTGLVLSASSVVLAGPVTNSGFEQDIGAVNATPFTNGWALQGSLGSGRVTTHSSLNGLAGPLVPQEGSWFALLEGYDGTNTSAFLTSAPFTVATGGAVMTYDYFYDTAGGQSTFYGTATPMGNNPTRTAAVIFVFLYTPSSPLGWTTSAPVNLASGDWALSFNITSGTSNSYFGLDNISVIDNNPVIPLPTGAAMAMVGMGAISLRRRRS